MIRAIAAVLLAAPSLALAGDEPPPTDPRDVYRVSTHPTTELRMARRRERDPSRFNPGWGRGWPRSPTFGGKAFDPTTQHAVAAPVRRPLPLRASYSFRMKHMRPGEEEFLDRVGFGAALVGQ